VAEVSATSSTGPIGELREELAICGRLLAARLRGQMQYKRSFLLQIVGNGLAHLGEMVSLFFLFDRFGSLGGWEVGEFAFLYGFSAFSFGIAHALGSGLSGFSEQVRRGEFDRLLTRPLGAFLQVVASDVQLRRLGGIVQGLVALAIAFRLGEVPWTPGRVAYFLVALVSATVLFVALFALDATFSFWTTEGTEAVNAVTYGGSYIATFPLHIFDLWLRGLFLWIIPLGFVVYFPSLYLLDKSTPLDLPGWLRFVAPLAALIFWLAALQLWRIGVRRYRSTGS
jgi:ABC-2 type transport system permease protein